MLDRGGCVIVFPAGGVSTSPDKLGRRPAMDAPWQPFTVQLIQRSKATVVPIFFGGQNSRLFQIASHLNQTLRLSLIFKEVRDRIGTILPIAIGDPIDGAAFAAATDRKAVALELMRRTYALAGQLRDDRTAKRIAAGLLEPAFVEPDFLLGTVIAEDAHHQGHRHLVGTHLCVVDELHGEVGFPVIRPHKIEALGEKILIGIIHLVDGELDAGDRRTQIPDHPDNAALPVDGALHKSPNFRVAKREKPVLLVQKHAKLDDPILVLRLGQTHNGFGH